MNKDAMIIMWERLGMETTCGQCPLRNGEECNGYHEGDEVYEDDEVCDSRFYELNEGNA